MRKLVVLPVAALAGAAIAVVPALAANQNVTLSDNAFTPATVTVSVGETVTWDYPSGSSVHNVHFDDGSFNQPPQPAPPGVPGVWPVSRKFDTPGEFTYLCDAHAQTMKGKVVVLAAGQSGGGGGGGTTDTTPQAGPEPDYDSPVVTGLKAKAQRKQLRLTFTIDEIAKMVVRVRRDGKLVLSRKISIGAPGKHVLAVKGTLPKGRLSVSIAFTDDAGNRTARTLKTKRA
jgi:plastocyanin